MAFRSWDRANRAAANPARAAAPTAAYWCRSKCCALADQGSNSQSSRAQSISNCAHRPAAAKAVPTRATPSAR